MPEIPAIYSPRLAKTVVSPAGRLLALLLSLSCLGLLATAAQLPPSPTGMGTHTQLGLAECQFAQRTGIPCPTCGMTTSFAWFIRGNLAASFYVQPMGALLAVLTAGAFWAGLYVALTGRPIHRLIRFLPGRYYVALLLSWALLAWAWKILIHLSGIDGWHG